VSAILFQTDLRIIDHRGHKFPPSLITLLPFKTQIECLPAIFKATSKLFGSLGWSDDKNWLNFSSIFFKNCRFRSSILACFWFHKKQHSSQVWQWHDLPKPITFLCQCITTNGIASFCIDHRWRQMAFFRVYQNGEGPIFARLSEIKQLLCAQSLILYYIKQTDSMLPCICPVTDHRGRQNVIRTSVTHSVIALCATFLFLPHFDVLCDLLLDRCMAT